MAHVSSSQSKPRRVYIAKWDFRNPFRVRTVFCWCFQSNRCLHVCCNMRSRSRSRSLLPEDAGSMWTTEEASKKLAVALQDKTGDGEEETNEKPQDKTGDDEEEKNEKPQDKTGDDEEEKNEKPQDKTGDDEEGKNDKPQDKTGDDEEEKNEKPQWQTAFKEGVDFDETNLKEHLKKPEYDTRHDLNFLTPTGRTVRCKVR